MSEMTASLPAPTPAVARWETEVPLLIMVILASIALWVVIAVSIIGLFYAAFFAVFFFLMQVGFIAHLRGSSIKLGPSQMPQLYARVVEMSERIGLRRIPEAYVMQAGGSLNALATKLFRANFIVLYSELLEACGDDTQAADFIIAHELGHLKAGHLRFQWLILPGRVLPFLGTAYSRAREYTADRYGFSQLADRNAAVRGLTILAAGPAHARHVNVQAMVDQRHDMNSVLMTIGRWMATHPPVIDRIAELDKSLAAERIMSGPAILGALGIVAFGFLLPFAGGGFLVKRFVDNVQKAAAAANRGETPTAASVAKRTTVADVPAAAETASRELALLAGVADRYHARTGKYPEDASALYAARMLEEPTSAELFDPFDGDRYGYEATDEGFTVWSSGNADPWKRPELKITRYAADRQHPAATATTGAGGK